jgi:hypothetical protein
VDQATLAFTATHAFTSPSANQPNGTYTITATPTDGVGETGTSVSVPVTVQIAAPVITSAGFTTTAINEGSSATLTGTFADPGVTDTHTVSVTWGDGGTSTQQLGAGATQFSLSYIYQNNPAGVANGGTFPVAVTVTDNNGAASASATANTSIVVNNVPATINTFTDTTSPSVKGTVGQAIPFTLTFSDPGTEDSYTATVGWGDSTLSSSYAVTPSTSAQTIYNTLSHTYAKSGTYVVTISITDSEGLASTGKVTEAYVAAAPVVTGGFSLQTDTTSSFVATSSTPATTTSAIVTTPAVTLASPATVSVTPSSSGVTVPMTRVAETAPPLSAIAWDTGPAAPIRLLASDDVRILVAPEQADLPPPAAPATLLFDEATGELDGLDPTDWSMVSPLGALDGIAFGDGWLMLPPPVVNRTNAARSS